MYKKFTNKLISWSANHPRNLPWKADKNPYQIWLSEIILQQTRVAQGTPYYLKFVKKFPTIFDLAEASEEEVLKLWQGLGYYTRARNLHHTARLIVEKYDGIFPNDYKSILALKGVGPYTAAAISSFAFDLSYPVVDGNVYRVIARNFGITDSIDERIGQKKILEISQKNISLTDPAAYNQAIMDFGATHCTPHKPLCDSCVMQKFCSAFESKNVMDIPFRTKKIKQKTRHFNYLVIIHKDQIILKKRGANDIWQGLYDFPLLEAKTKTRPSTQALKKHLEAHIKTPKWPSLKKSSAKVYQQKLTHQKVNAYFYIIEAKELVLKENSVYQLFDRSIVHTLAVPKIINDYLQDSSII